MRDMLMNIHEYPLANGYSYYYYYYLLLILVLITVALNKVQSL